MFVGIRLGRRARTHREASADLYALERAHPRGQRAIEQIRLPEAKSVLDPIAGFDSAAASSAPIFLRLSSPW